MTNPLLESFSKPPKACVTNSNCPQANLKGKGNPDLPILRAMKRYCVMLAWVTKVSTSPDLNIEFTHAKKVMKS